MAAKIRIGCSGWQYEHWRGRFYPRDLGSERWLEFYAARFDTVELNNSSYRLPTAEAFDAWRRRTPSVPACRLLSATSSSTTSASGTTCAGRCLPSRPGWPGPV